jgi:hypothetical protein
MEAKATSEIQDRENVDPSTGLLTKRGGSQQWLNASGKQGSSKGRQPFEDLTRLYALSASPEHLESGGEPQKQVCVLRVCLPAVNPCV